jgi:DNA replication protein DnaC
VSFLPVESALAASMAAAEAALAARWASSAPDRAWRSESATERILARLPGCLRDASEVRPRVKAKRLLDVADRWDPERTGSIVLLGPTGVGKTSAAALVVHRLLGSTWSGRDRIAWARSADASSASDSDLRSWRDCALLVLDDLGREDYRASPVVWDVVDRRYQCGRATLTTTNVARDAMVALYAERRIVAPDALVRRLTEGARTGHWVEVAA